MAEAADWSNLNMDMVEVIGEKFDSWTDYVRFRASCFGWKFYLPDKPPKRLVHRRFPYLLLPPKSVSSSSSLLKFSLLSSLDLDGEVVDELQLPPLGEDFMYRGFSKGWLIAFEKQGPSIYLIDPFTGNQRLLPPMNTFPNVFEYLPHRVGEEFVIRRNTTNTTDRPEMILTYADMYFFCIRKAVLSSPPTETNCIAMAIYGEGFELAYCRYGDQRWTRVGDFFYVDVIVYKDKFYAVENSGEVISISFESSTCPPKVVKFARPPKPKMNGGVEKVYLVVVETSSRDHQLLLVARDLIYSADDCYETIPRFKILKLDSSSNTTGGKWSEKKLETLGNHVLFLGWNESVSFPSTFFPGCKGDLIYFTDDYYEGHNEQCGLLNVRGSDIGVFNLEKNTITRIQRLQHPQAIWPPPTWVFRRNP